MKMKRKLINIKIPVANSKISAPTAMNTKSSWESSSLLISPLGNNQRPITSTKSKVWCRANFHVLGFSWSAALSYQNKFYDRFWDIFVSETHPMSDHINVFIQNFKQLGFFLCFAVRLTKTFVIVFITTWSNVSSYCSI